MKSMFTSKILFAGCIVASLQAVTLDPLRSLIFLPKPGSTVSIAQPIIAGIMVDKNQNPLKNKQVSIFVDGRKAGAVSTNEDGVWSYKLNESQALNNGCHRAQAYITIGTNNVWSQATNFSVCITQASQNAHRAGNVSVANSAIVFPFEGTYTSTATPTVVVNLLDSSFGAVSGETVNIKIDSSTIGSPVSDSNGIASYQSPSLSDGSHIADAHCVQTAVDLTTNNFTVDTVAPSVPTITSPTQNETVTTSNVIVSGTTEADATIGTFLDGSNYADFSYADGSGNWSIEYPLDNGPHSVTAQATDLAGNNGSVSSARNFTVDA